MLANTETAIDKLNSGLFEHKAVQCVLYNKLLLCMVTISVWYSHTVAQLCTSVTVVVWNSTVLYSCTVVQFDCHSVVQLWYCASLVARQ